MTTTTATIMSMSTIMNTITIMNTNITMTTITIMSTTTTMSMSTIMTTAITTIIPPCTISATSSGTTWICRRRCGRTSWRSTG